MGVHNTIRGRLSIQQDLQNACERSYFVKTFPLAKIANISSALGNGY